MQLYLTSNGFNDHYMKKMGQLLVEDRQAVIDLLESAEIGIDPTADDIHIIDEYLTYLPDSDSLKYGTAYLIELKDKSSFSGSIDNESVYGIYDNLYDYWDEHPTFTEIESAYEEEQKSNAGGIFGGIINKGLGVTQKVVEGQQKRKYGALDLATKQAESQQAMLQGVLAQRQAQLKAQERAQELKAKQRKTVIIAVSSVLAVTAILGTIIYLKRRKNG